MSKPLVNVAFAIALRNAAEAHGDNALAAIADAAICGDRERAEHVGAIMHGATWRSCGVCRGAAKVAGRKCRACFGTGADQTHPKIEAIRNAALVACSCGANVTRHGTTLVCCLSAVHGGDHNTAADGTGDSFPNRNAA